MIYDLAAGVYRWRQIMPKAIGEAEIGPEHPELAGARQIMERSASRSSSTTAHATRAAPGGGYVLTGKADSDAGRDPARRRQRIRRGKCICGYYRQFGMKNGPCRHMLALRWRDVGRGAGSVPAERLVQPAAGKEVSECR